jgi:hypothetical protein
MIPDRFQVGKYARWLEKIKLCDVDSAREFHSQLVHGKKPYIVVYSRNQKKYVVYFNITFDSFGESKSNKEQFFEALENAEDSNNADEPASKRRRLMGGKTTTYQPKSSRKSPRRIPSKQRRSRSRSRKSPRRIPSKQRRSRSRSRKSPKRLTRQRRSRSRSRKR